MSLPLLIFILPLISSIICLICIIFKENRKAEVISSLIISFAAVLSIFCYLKINSFVGVYEVYNWISLEKINFNIAVLYDPLTAIMFSKY